MAATTKIPRSLMAEETAIIFVCPSAHKECGIGRYCHHAINALKGVFRHAELFVNLQEAALFVEKADFQCLVLFQHEYSLVDFSSHLSETETTSDVISGLVRLTAYGQHVRVGLVMHTLIPNHLRYDFVNRQILTAPIPVFSTTREGARKFKVNYLELGVPTEHVNELVKGSNIYSCESSSKNTSVGILKRLRIGSFGFLSPNKNVESILKLCAATDCDICANFAAKDRKLSDKIKEKAKVLGVFGVITFDFLDEKELVQMLMGCDIVYLPQHDIEHFSTSATARLPLPLGKMIITPSVRPFHDLSSVVKFVNDSNEESFIRGLINDRSLLDSYKEASKEFSSETSMSNVYHDLFNRIFTGNVWCGGFISSAQYPSNKNSMILNANQTTIQNTEGFKKIGHGIWGGKVMYLASSMRSERDAIEINDKNNMVTWDSICITESIFHSGKEAWKKFADKNRTELSMQLRALLGDRSCLLSVLEFLDMPAFSKFELLHGELGIAEEIVDEFIYVAAEADLFQFSFETGEIELIVRLFLKLRSALSSVPYSKSRIVWAAPSNLELFGLKQITMPSALLLMDEEDIIRNTYDVLLQRSVDPVGFDSWSKRLASGSSKSQVVWDISRSSEAEEKGFQLAYDQHRWEIREHNVHKLMQLASVLMPAHLVLQSENFSELGIRYSVKKSSLSDEKNTKGRNGYSNQR